MKVMVIVFAYNEEKDIFRVSNEVKSSYVI